MQQKKKTKKKKENTVSSHKKFFKNSGKFETNEKLESWKKLGWKKQKYSNASMDFAQLNLIEKETTLTQKKKKIEKIAHSVHFNSSKKNAPTNKHADEKVHLKTSKKNFLRVTTPRTSPSKSRKQIFMAAHRSITVIHQIF